MSIKQSINIVVAAVIGGVVGAGIVLSEVRAQAAHEWVADAKTVTANSINLTDGTGRVRCRLTAEGGNPICFFYGSGGRTMMRIGLLGPEDNNTPFIAMNDKDMHERLGIGLAAKQENKLASYLRMRDSEGRARLLTSLMDGFGPTYSLLDNSGTFRGGLSQFDEKQQNAGLFLANPVAGDYAHLLVSEIGSSLSLTSGNAKLSERSDKSTGTNVFMSDGAGNLKMHLGVEKGGATRLWRYGKGIYGWVDKQVERDLKKQAEIMPKVEDVNLYGYPPKVETMPKNDEADLYGYPKADEK